LRFLVAALFPQPYIGNFLAIRPPVHPKGCSRFFVLRPGGIPFLLFHKPFSTSRDAPPAVSPFSTLLFLPHLSD
jgi:hypothetical protein